MFTKKEINQFRGDYFTILRIEEKYIEVQSNNTGHCWNIFKRTAVEERPVMLYHKHRRSDNWYHEHRAFWGIEVAVREIKKHDAFVVRNPDYLQKGLRNMKSPSGK